MSAEVMVDVPAEHALLRSVGSSDPRDLYGRSIEISTHPLEGAPPFHESGYFLRLMTPEPRHL